MNDDEIDLGWPVLCLRAEPFELCVSWYQRLGFQVVGGQQEHGWAQMFDGVTELSLMSFLKADMINMRGGPIASLASRCHAEGLAPFYLPGMDPTAHEQAIEGHRSYDPSAWPASFHTLDDRVLDKEQAGDFLVSSPDGHLVYFDSVPLERYRFDDGELFASDSAGASSLTSSVGPLTLQLPVESVDDTGLWLGRLGFAGHGAVWRPRGRRAEGLSVQICGAVDLATWGLAFSSAALDHCRERLLGVELQDGGVWLTAYDPMGRRVTLRPGPNVAR